MWFISKTQLFFGLVALGLAQGCWYYLYIEVGTLHPVTGD